MKKNLLIGVLFLFPLVAGAAPGAADSYVLREGLSGYDGTADTMLMPIPANNNYGAYPSLLVGKMGDNERRSLLRFNLERLKGQKVKSAVLTLWQVNLGQFRQGRFTIGFFAIGEANAGWQEGRGSGQPAVASEPVWKARARARTDTPWAGSPGLSTEGVDYVSPAAASVVYDAANNGGKVTVALPAELVQRWIDEPASNAGLLLKIIETEGAGMGAFRSSEYENASLRPQLEVFVE